MKSLASRYFQLKCEHASTATYLKRFGQRDDDQCWWCEKAAETREHLFRHCRKWKSEQQELWKAAGRETGWKPERCRHVQMIDFIRFVNCSQQNSRLFRSEGSYNDYSNGVKVLTS